MTTDAQRIERLEAEVSNLRSAFDTFVRRHDAQAASAIVAAPETNSVATLRAVCAARGIETDGYGTISEAEAGLLVGWKPGTIKNRRLTDCPIRPTRRGRVWRYRLEALAEYLDR